MATIRHIGNKIVKLRYEGKKCEQIATELECSLGTISYHLKKHKTFFDQKLTKGAQQSILNRFRNFTGRTGCKRRSKNVKANCHFNKTKGMKYPELLRSLIDSPFCALTGKPIYFNDVQSYSFDHLVPISRGGDCSKENFNLLSKEVDLAKNNLPMKFFVKMCKEIARANS